MKEIDTLAPMLKKLGYDTESDMPSYGVVGQFVLNNTNELKSNAIYWNAKTKSYAREPPEMIFLWDLLESLANFFMSFFYFKQKSF
jgi:hypothetical protein